MTTATEKAMDFRSLVEARRLGMAPFAPVGALWSLAACDRHVMPKENEFSTELCAIGDGNGFGFNFGDGGGHGDGGFFEDGNGCGDGHGVEGNGMGNAFGEGNGKGYGLSPRVR